MVVAMRYWQSQCPGPSELPPPAVLFDAGGGAIPLTWQAYSGGVAYSAANWVDVSLGCRYLTFQAKGNNGVQNLTLKGVILAANIRF
jgi:hypothetical protein